MLVDDRTVWAEVTKHPILPAPIAGSGGSAVAARAVKEMAVIASATESRSDRTGTECLSGRGVVVFHVSVMGVCLSIVLGRS